MTDTHCDKNNFIHVESIFNQAFEVCRQRQIQRIIHLGDFFTSRVGQGLNELLSLDRILKKAKELDIQFFAIAGNHDKTDYKSSDNFLIPFERDNFSLFSEPKSFRHGLDHNLRNVNLHFMSFYHESELYSEKLKEIKIEKGQINILFTHCSINGVRNLSGKAVEDSIDNNLFEDFDMVFVGHYHNKQSFKNIRYIGSTDPRNWGEDSEKGFTLFDTETGNTEFIKAKFKEFVKLEVSVSEINSNEDLEELREFIEIKSKNSNVRLLLNGTEEQLINFKFSDELKNLNVNIKKQKSEYKESVEFADSGNFVEFDTDSIFQNFKDYCDKNDIKGKQKIIGLKLLKGNYV
jgi:exonuclease SbcD